MVAASVRPDVAAVGGVDAGRERRAVLGAGAVQVGASGPAGPWPRRRSRHRRARARERFGHRRLPRRRGLLERRDGGRRAGRRAATPRRPYGRTPAPTWPARLISSPAASFSRLAMSRQAPSIARAAAKPPWIRIAVWNWLAAWSICALREQIHAAHERRHALIAGRERRERAVGHVAAPRRLDRRQHLRRAALLGGGPQRRGRRRVEHVVLRRGGQRGEHGRQQLRRRAGAGPDGAGGGIAARRQDTERTGQRAARRAGFGEAHPRQVVPGGIASTATRPCATRTSGDAPTRTCERPRHQRLPRFVLQDFQPRRNLGGRATPWRVGLGQGHQRAVVDARLHARRRAPWPRRRARAPAAGRPARACRRSSARP